MSDPIAAERACDEQCPRRATVVDIPRPDGEEPHPARRASIQALYSHDRG